MSQTTNAMTQMTEPVQQYEPVQQSTRLTQELQMEIDRQLAIHLQEIDAARARAQSYDGTNVELANVRPTTHTQTIENQATGESTNVESTHAKLSRNSQQQQSNPNTNITSVDTQV